MDLRTLEELAPTVAARHGATAAAWISQASVERVRDRVGRRVRDVERVLARAYAVLLEAALGVTESLPQDALRALLLDEAVAGELLLAVAEPGGSAPDAAVLRAACAAADAPGVDGSQVAAAFRRRVAQGDVGQERSRALLTDEGWRAWKEAGATGDRDFGAPRRSRSHHPGGLEDDGVEEASDFGTEALPPSWHAEGPAAGRTPREEAPPVAASPKAPGYGPFGMAPPVASTPADVAESTDVGDEDEADESRDRKPLRRTPHMDLTPEPPFAPGDRFTVGVYVDRQAMRPGESGEDVVIDAPADQERFELEVWLVGSADHFVVAEALQPLVIERSRDRSSTASFEVTVRDDATAAEPPFLSALFSYRGRACGRVTRTVPLAVRPDAGPAAARRAGERPLSMAPAAAPGMPGFAAVPADAPATGVAAATAATAPDAAGSAPGPAAAVAAPADPPASVEIHPGVAADLVVRIAAVSNDGRRFTCRVTTPLLDGYETGRTGDWELPQSTAEWVGNVMADFTSSRATPFVRRIALQGAGETLFEAAPEVFREAFWRLVDDPDAGARLQTIALVSEEPYVPWELMIPTRPRAGADPEERRPLGVELVVARWTARDGVLPPQALPLADSFVVAPTDSGLANAAVEADMVVSRFAGERVDPASVEKLDDVFAAGGRSLLHFVCHGKSGNGQQTLVLQGHQEMRPLFLRGMPHLEHGVRASRPLVFLNACEVGRLEPGLVGAGGFAEAFMNLGAGGVVAALWSVKDDLAHQLAEEFYRRVEAEPTTPYAAILRDLRARSYADDRAAEDTWAAYCFYGDPLAAGQAAD